jgi:hypothetical protein
VWVVIIEGKSYLVGSGGEFLAGMEGVVLEESGAGDSGSPFRPLAISPPIFVFLESVDVSLDEEHLARSVVLPDIQYGWCLKLLDVSA